MEAPATDVVQRAQEGDDVAFRSLVHEVYPLMFRWALLQVGDPDDAQDVVQSALVRVHERMGEFRRDARFTTWLYAIVRRTSMDWRRAQVRREHREQQYAALQPVTSLSPIIDRLDIEQRLLALWGAMLELPVRQREVFDLIELQGLDAGAVAQMTGVAPSTVRVHLLRARRELRRQMLENREA